MGAMVGNCMLIVVTMESIRRKLNSCWLQHGRNDAELGHPIQKKKVENNVKILLKLYCRCLNETKSV